MGNVCPWWTRTERPASLGDLLSRLLDLQTALGATLTSARPATTAFAFRGMGNAEHRLQCSLVHQLGLKHDSSGLQSERQQVERFRARAWRFLGCIERAHLDIVSNPLAAPDEPAPLDWVHARIWNPLAVARHFGTSTRLIDWTTSAFVAAYFAAISHPTMDGVVWWFNQSQLEDTIHNDDWWRRWQVTSLRSKERMAFQTDATMWFAKLHPPIPFRRIEVQRGFFTTCGRFDVPHDEAVDQLGDSVTRGRLIVPREMKATLLDNLEPMGIHAVSLDVPQADALGRDVGGNAGT
ncbi:MAG: FRG domain-containing protein [Phycisphaerales bacterium]